MHELAVVTSVTADMSELWGAAPWSKARPVLSSLLWAVPSLGLFQTNLSPVCLGDGAG